MGDTVTSALLMTRHTAGVPPDKVHARPRTDSVTGRLGSVPGPHPKRDFFYFLYFFSRLVGGRWASAAQPDTELPPESSRQQGSPPHRDTGPSVSQIGVSASRVGWL